MDSLETEINSSWCRGGRAGQCTSWSILRVTVAFVDIMWSSMFIFTQMLFFWTLTSVRSLHIKIYTSINLTLMKMPEMIRRRGIHFLSEQYSLLFCYCAISLLLCFILLNHYLKSPFAHKLYDIQCSNQDVSKSSVVFLPGGPMTPGSPCSPRPSWPRSPFWPRYPADRHNTRAEY